MFRLDIKKEVHQNQLTLSLGFFFFSINAIPVFIDVSKNKFFFIEISLRLILELIAYTHCGSFQLKNTNGKKQIIIWISILSGSSLLAILLYTHGYDIQYACACACDSQVQNV